MSWQTLFADQKIKTHFTSKRELDDLREIVERDLRDAAIPGLSTDRRFATAYNAALQTSTMAVACSGYRVSGVGHHIATFEAAELALGPASAQSMAYFDACRRKRTSVDYDRVLDVTGGFWHLAGYLDNNHEHTIKQQSYDRFIVRRH